MPKQTIRKRYQRKQIYLRSIMVEMADKSYC